jgi:hypothetical protein
LILDGVRKIERQVNIVFDNRDGIIFNMVVSAERERVSRRDCPVSRDDKSKN